MTTWWGCQMSDLTADQLKLTELESIIQHGFVSFVEVGMALAEIRAEKLYRLKHATFEHYLAERWALSRSRGYELMTAAGVATRLVGAPNIDTISVDAALQLAGVGEDMQARVWEAALAQSNNGRPTADDIRTLLGKQRRDGKNKSPGQQDLRTPRWLFERLTSLFGPFALDAYAESHNALCEKYFTRAEDANWQPWLDVTFANPEFASMATATRKAVEESERGVQTCMLGPVGCTQDWYHRWAIRGTVWVPDARINYDKPDGTPTHSADRDSIVMTFGGRHRNPHWAQGQFRVRALQLKPQPTTDDEGRA